MTLKMIEREMDLRGTKFLNLLRTGRTNNYVLFNFIKDKSASTKR